jgi:hypothetical protein
MRCIHAWTEAEAARTGIASAPSAPTQVCSREAAVPNDSDIVEKSGRRLRRHDGEQITSQLTTAEKEEKTAVRGCILGVEKIWRQRFSFCGWSHSHSFSTFLPALINWGCFDLPVIC